MFDASGAGSVGAWIADRWRCLPAALRMAIAVAAGVGVTACWLASGASAPPQDAIPSEQAPGIESAESTSSARADIVVHVVGAVREPGVYTVPEGCRVADAIARAGGALGNAALEAINLARVLVDGEQVYVPTADEAAAGGPSAWKTPAGSARESPRVNLNTATAEELDALPGIGPATAQKILDDRAKNGPFASPEDLMRIPGIGPKKFDALKDLVTTR